MLSSNFVLNIRERNGIIINKAIQDRKHTLVNASKFEQPFKTIKMLMISFYAFFGYTYY